jgi:hypothetical protein
MVVNRSSNVRKACRETGWPRHIYHRALEMPEVCAYTDAMINQEVHAAVSMIRQEMLMMVYTQVEIAKDVKQGQAATRAFTAVKGFLTEHQGTLKETVQLSSIQHENPRLDALLETFDVHFEQETVTQRVIAKRRAELDTAPPSTPEEPFDIVDAE